MTMDAKYYSDRIGIRGTESTKRTMPYRTVEGIVTTHNYNQVGIGKGKFIIFMGNIDPAIVADFKAHVASKPKAKSKPTETAGDNE